MAKWRMQGTKDNLGASLFPLRRRQGKALLYVLVVLLGSLVAVLTYELRVLKPQADELRRRKALPYVGQLVPIVRAATMHGDSVTIGETVKGRSQVLFFFTTSCQYCAATRSEWHALAMRLLADSAHRFDVYGVSLSSRDSTLDYLATESLAYPVVKIEDPRFRMLFRVKGVPMTLVLDSRGVIAHVHPSIFATSVQRDSVYTAAVDVAGISAKTASAAFSSAVEDSFLGNTAPP